MIVLGISETHCATAAVLKDGAIVACASEERFTRLKNDAGYPRLAVDALRDGRPDDALAAALRIDAPNWFIAPALVAASAALAGRTDVARRSAARLLELYPEFPQNAGAEIHKWQVDSDLGETLLRGLRAAGVDVAAAPPVNR